MELYIEHMSQQAVKGNRLKKAAFTILGTIFVGIAAVGIVLPILPTTPFLLLAAACYLKGSEKMHHWLLTNRIFGSYIRNYKEGKGMSPKAKIFTLTLLWATILISTVCFTDLVVIQVVLLVVCIGVTAHLVKIPTYREIPHQPRQVTQQ